jgi:predicted nucleic acid-binding Zn finger protein
MPKAKTRTVDDRFKRIKARKSMHNLVRKLLRLVKKTKASPKAKSVKMTSFTDATKIYTVSTHSCTCPDYKFRRQARGESCKHMRAFVQNASN